MSGVIFRNGTPYPGTGGGSGSGGHTIVDESGVSLTQRANLKFEGAEVTDDSTNDTTIVTVDKLSNQDMQDIKDAFNPAGAAPLRMFNYSTDEQVVGTWIDGKPLYQTSVYVSSFSNNGTKRVSHGISDIRLVINLFGYMTDGSQAYPVPRAHTNQWYCSAEATSTELIFSSSVDYSGMNGYVTIQYTKTTD